MATLRRAVALTDPHAVAVRVGDDLHLDVAGPGQVALDVALVAAEALEGLVLSGLERVGGFFGAAHDAHATTATAIGGFDGHRPTELFAERHDLGGVGQKLGGARHALHAGLLGGDATGHLVAHHHDGRRGRSDEGHTLGSDGLGEFGVLREEPVTGVHTVGTAALDDIEDLGGIEVRLRSGRTVEGVRLVGETDVEGVTVEIGIDGDRSHAHFLACPDDPDRDLATVCDENLFEHGIW